MSDITEMSVYQIENYLDKLKWEEHDAKRKAERKAEELFKSSHKIEIYQASDYCGMRNGRTEFYYGYEDVDDNEEWCFTAKEDGVEVMRLPQSKLWYIPDADIMWYLLSGIGQYLQAKDAA